MRLPTTLLCTCTRATTSTLTPLASTSNLFTLPKFSRSIHAEASRDPKSRIPSPRGPTTSTSTLLSASKRKLESYEPKLGDWNSLFTKSGIDMKEIGMAVKERRYLLRLLESYRQGHAIEDVVKSSTPKKKYRGWGPSVQNGHRVRGAK